MTAAPQNNAEAMPPVQIGDSAALAAVRVSNAVNVPKLSDEEKKNRIVEIYRAGHISSEQFKKAFGLIKSGERDPILENFLNNKIPVETFRNTF